ncbi:MAG: hypothetical protein PHE17_14490 [Thiothrix sp.]|uniref:PA3496 family putative envelope integrity protein n=1 Tax=Thiothrix sp. TaxID=1032 RepID=UPI0026273C33|nr:hypothetical protein [Thiothrix sp.]MDD5394218.1 hypothetical protein [Thiothrix sp.]
MRNNNEFDIERDEELFVLEKTAPPPADTKKVKPHIIRRNVEDYLERKALERRLKDVFDDNF